MSKVLRPPMTDDRSSYFSMRSAEISSSRSPKSMFARNTSFSESEIQTQIGVSDSEEDKSEAIEDLAEDDDDDREPELPQSDFDDEDEDEEDENGSRDPFQRQLGYPPLPRYKTPTPANPLDKLGTLTPMEEMTEPPSSGANSPNSYAARSTRAKSRGPSKLAIEDDDRTASRSSMRTLGVDGERGRSLSRNSMNNLTVGMTSRSHSRSSNRGASPSASRPSSNRSAFPRDDDSEFTSKKPGGSSSKMNSPRNLSSPDSMSAFSGETMRRNSKTGGGGFGLMPSSSGGDTRTTKSPLPSRKSPKRNTTPLPKLESDMDSDFPALGDLGGHQIDMDAMDSEDPTNQSFDRVRSWQRHAGGSSPPVYSALADAEFATALDGMIMKLHGSKVDWEYRVKLADDLTAALKNVSPQVLLKNMSQIIPLVSNIAAESHFRVSLSILSTVTTLGDRLRDCKAYLGSKSIPNADLTWLIRRLCTVCGESRSTLRTEGALALSRLIKGAGPELVADPLYSILKCGSKKSSSGNGRLTAGPRIKAAALDALTFALLTFPRDDFDLPELAKHACKCLWNSKRRVRQASLECLAVVAHAMGPSISLPMFRNFIEEAKMELSSSSSSSGTPRRGATNYSPVATPTAAVQARVSRHLLPSPSPAGLVEYAVMIPQRTLQQSSYDKAGKGGLDPILNGHGSGKNRHSAMVGADIQWILAGTGPTVNSTFYSPGSQLDWLAEESVNGGLVSEGESNKSSDHHYSKSKMKNSHSYNGTMDMMDTPMKPTWSSSGSYMERYHKSSSNGFLTDGLGKGDKGYSLLPNKYPSSHGGGGSSTNGELPNLSSAFGHHNMNSGSGYGDFNSNVWSGHDDFFSNGSSKGFKGNSNNKGRGFGNANGMDKYSDSSSRRFDTYSQQNTSVDQSDSDHEPYGGGGGSSPFRPSYQNHGSGEGHFIKISREYDEMMMTTDDGKKDGLDSAGSTNTRDSGVSSLKSSKTIPSPPSMGASYESRQSGGGKMGGNKKRSPSPGTNGMDTLSNSRSWRSTPDVPELAKAEDELRKSGGGNDIGSDVSRSQSGSSGFLHRKPVLARASQRKASTDSIQNRINGLELRDYDDGTESEATIPGGGYVKEKIPKPVSYHLSLSTNNITNSEDDMDKSPSYSTSSLRRPANKQNGTKSYLKARSRSKTPVGNRGGLISSGMSSMKGGGDGDSIGSFNDLGGSSPTKTKTGAGGGGGKSIPSKRVYKGSFRESNAVKNAGGNAEVFPSDLKPVESPRHSLSLALNNLNSSEWETNLDGFRLLVRLTRHHPESLQKDLHNININGMRHLMNLRSQVCRAACLFFKELFLSQGKLMEQDVEKILEKLLDKSSDTNKFIREDSASAIETMVMQLTPAKILHCLDTYGLKHRNPIVRTTSARMLLLLIRRLGSERCLYDHPEKVLPMVCHFLQEGSLDTRTHAKAALAELITHTAFDAQLRRQITPDTLRNVSKIIQTIKSEVCKNKPELNQSAV